MDWTIKELREALQMSQKTFASYFGIPVGTLRNWEQGVSNPPEYVKSMMVMSIRRNHMINIETVAFMDLVDDLQKKAKGGFDEFSNATSENFDSKLFYDLRVPAGENTYRVVQDVCLVDEPEYYHHDAISHYGDHDDEFDIYIELADSSKALGTLVIDMKYSEYQILIYDDGTKEISKRDDYIKERLAEFKAQKRKMN